jgi:probable phosphoglycerate mutase
MHAKRYLRRLIRVGYSWIYLLWIYISVGVRFIRWQMQPWFQQFHTAGSTQTTMKKQTLLLIRHGQTTWNVEHRLPGQLPGVELNDTGRQQAARLADALTVLPISAIISSPLERARETAEILAKGRDLSVRIEPELADTDVGKWAGQVIEQLSRDDPAWKTYVKDPTTAPAGVETFPQVQQRVVGAIERWREQDNIGAYPAFVAHADVIKLILAHYMGLDVGRAGSMMIDNASVSMIELEEEHKPNVIAIGWSPRPGWLKPPLPEQKDEGEVPKDEEQAQKP